MVSRDASKSDGAHEDIQKQLNHYAISGQSLTLVYI